MQRREVPVRPILDPAVGDRAHVDPEAEVRRFLDFARGEWRPQVGIERRGGKLAQVPEHRRGPARRGIEPYIADRQRIGHRILAEYRERILEAGVARVDRLGRQNQRRSLEMVRYVTRPEQDRAAIRVSLI